MRKRLIVCSNFYPPNFIGGAELIAHHQARALRDFGWDVVVFAGDTPGNAERHVLRRETYDGFPIYRVGLHLSDVLPDFVNFSHRAVERHFDALLEAYAPDVVHLHNLVGLSVGLIHLAKRRGIRTVLTVHDHWGFCYKNTLIKWGTEICGDYTRCAECMPVIHDGEQRQIPIRMRRDFVRMQLEEVNAFIAPSRYLAGAYIRAGFPADRFKVIWYGVDVGRFERVRKTASDAVRFSFIGHFGKHKGVHTILQALPLVEGKDKVLVNFVGEGEDRAWCEQRVRELRWEGSVRFWGQVDHGLIEEVYRETDVLILPSVWPENQPVSLTEAMASRTAIIASRIGGVPELVDDARSGYLFEPGNAKELADRMSELVRHKWRLVEFGENGFRRIVANTLANQVRKILRVYEEDPSRGLVVADDALFICVGKRVESQCSWAMNALSRQGDRRWRFVMSDWLEEDQIGKAKVLWVMDREAGMSSVLVGLRSRLPLLVPEDNAELKALCVYGRCGLYYKDAIEAIRCLEYLTHHEGARKVMGQNGYELLDRNRVPDAQLLGTASWGRGQCHSGSKVPPGH